MSGMGTGRAGVLLECVVVDKFKALNLSNDRSLDEDVWSLCLKSWQIRSLQTQVRHVRIDVLTESVSSLQMR
jgi:hypothetical protein